MRKITNIRKEQSSINTQKLLKKVTKYYRSTFSKVSTAYEYLQNKGITDKSIINTFQIGFANGSIFQIIPEKGEIIEKLKKTGILDENGEEFFNNCVIFPIFDTNGNIINIVGAGIFDACLGDG